MSGSVVGNESVWATGVETTYGTGVTPDRFYEFLNETIKRKNNVLQSKGLRPGRHMQRGSRRVIASHDAAGDATLEVATNGFGRQFQQILGGTPTFTAGSGGNAAAITHVYPMGKVAGVSQTLQKQLYDAAGNLITTLTYPGSKIMAAEFSISVTAGILQVKLTFDCRDELNSTAAATASYTTTRLFNFEQGSLSIAGSPVVNILDATIKFENPQDVNRYFLGSAGLKAEPADSDYPKVSGTLAAEIVDESLWTLFKNDTAAALSLPFVGGIVPGASTTHESVTFGVPEVHLTGETPTVAGIGVQKVSIPYEGAFDGTDVDATITYVTSDTAA
jgi:hypothetical protein